MLRYCRLTSLKRRKEPNDDSQADYLPFYSIHGAGTDAQHHQEARIDDNQGTIIQRNADAAGNASILIEAR
jgi:hypothetical protein